MLPERALQPEPLGHGSAKSTLDTTLHGTARHGTARHGMARMAWRGVHGDLVAAVKDSDGDGDDNDGEGDDDRGGDEGGGDENDDIDAAASQAKQRPCFQIGLPCRSANLAGGLRERLAKRQVHGHRWCRTAPQPCRDRSFSNKSKASSCVSRRRGTTDSFQPRSR